MHVVYYATRDEYGRVQQTITRAREVYYTAIEEEGVGILLMIPPSGYDTHVVPGVDVLRVETEPAP